ncbi:MAG: hypothetical protein MI867_26680 [Pseudomonadales bacterium]|nr:hypothetical protein [Pseudomonadales bacterium]
MKKGFTYLIFAALLSGCGSGDSNDSDPTSDRRSEGDDKYLGQWYLDCKKFAYVLDATTQYLVEQNIEIYGDDAAIWATDNLTIERNQIQHNVQLYSDSNCEIQDPLQDIIDSLLPQGGKWNADIISENMLLTREGYSFRQYLLSYSVFGSKIPISYYYDDDRLYKLDIVSGASTIETQDDDEYSPNFEIFYEKQ